MKQIRKLKNWVTTYLNKSVKFIKDFVYKYRLEVRRITREFDIPHKSKIVIKLFIDTSITGLAIYYCINFHNFFSYGLTSLLGIYYLELVVSIIKGKEKNNKWYSE